MYIKQGVCFNSVLAMETKERHEHNKNNIKFENIYRLYHEYNFRNNHHTKLQCNNNLFLIAVCITSSCKKEFIAELNLIFDLTNQNYINITTIFFF